MGDAGGGMVGMETDTVTAGTTAIALRLPNPCTQLILRAAVTNVNSIYVRLGTMTATTGDLMIRSGETITLDVSNMLMLKKMLSGLVEGKDFITDLSYYSATAGQILHIDALTI